ncbi:DUF2569 family protein [Dokdonia sinensis]|uniref:DUF2569 family protein n=1 Tax=Dokdonia sinensis TaxID=2479847 RepID=A0A3M0FVI6_9FLAO|nr:DUF3857 domain-containing protein [Dokdonia sinensis]RMB56515.1 DUF2569 family protein [Dokdonia sinensis]
MRYLLIFFVFLFSLNAFSQKPTIGKIPDWVESPPYNTTVKDQEDQSGFYYLLSDRQYHIPKETTYIHLAIKVLNTEGITQMSDITLDFDPTYENLVLHNIDVIRNGERINKLNLSNVQTIQRESNLERKLYDGRLTSLINLRDIREGDILDYSYSIIGENPIYEGGYAGQAYFQFTIPVGEMRCKFIVPKGEDFNFEYYNGAPKAEIIEKDNNLEYSWNLDNVDYKYYDVNTPIWYDDFPYVEISNYDSWESIVNQYVSLYTLNSADKVKLKELVTTEFSSHQDDLSSNKEELVNSLIDFVQDEVRYFGFENGLNSHLPESPLKVLEQRYGDCKGKSFLLSELLNLYGVEAHPMLVHSYNGGVIDDKLPNPNLFDHCVVSYKLEGTQYFVDPTMSNQGLINKKRNFPDYKKGLILKSGEKELVSIPNKTISGIDIQEIYDINKINGSGELTIVTTYTGTNADNIRSDFAQRSTAAIQTDYLQFYSALFPTIKENRKITIEDNKLDGNKLVVRESYIVDSIWSKSPDNDKLIYIEIYPLTLENFVNPPKSPERSGPYSIGYPVNLNYDIAVNLPEKWSFEDYNQEIKSDYFSYSQEISYYLKKLVISYDYQHFKEFVKADDVPKYIADHNKIRDDLSYFITYDLGLSQMAETPGISWISIVIILLTLVLGVYGAYKIYQSYDVPARSSRAKGKPLGGWLILVSIGLILTPIVILYGFITELSFVDAYTWKTLWNTEGIQGKPLLLVVIFELIVNILRIIFTALIIILFFEKRTIVPRLMIVFYASTLLFLMIDAVLVNILVSEAMTPADWAENAKEIGRAFIACAIWIPYFIISERVKDTFVHYGPNYQEQTEKLISTVQTDILRETTETEDDNDRFKPL